MKASQTTFVLFTFGIFAVFVAGFCLGGMYTSGKAVRALNQLSVAEDAGIKVALDQRDYERADMIADGAINAHLNHLRLWSSPALLNRAFYLVPWTEPSESTTRTQFHYLQGFFADHPDVLNSQNAAFLSSHH